MDTGIIEQFFWQAFNIPPNNFWGAIGSAIIAGALIFFLAKVIFDKMTNDDKTSLTSGIALIFAIATIIYIWYSGTWQLLLSIISLIILSSAAILLLLIWIYLGTSYRKFRHKHISAGKENALAKKELIEAKHGAKRGEINELEKDIENVTKIKEKYTQAEHTALIAAKKEFKAKNYSEAYQYLLSAKKYSESLLYITKREIGDLKLVKDRKFKKLLKKDLEIITSDLQSINDAIKYIQDENFKLAEKILNRLITDTKHEKKDETKEEKEIRKKWSYDNKDIGYR